MELEERLKPTWMFERYAEKAETFDFSRPKVPIKLHRPLALCLNINEWQIAVEISNFINSKVRLNLSPHLRISYLESWHHWDFFPEGIFGFRQIVPPQGCLWRSKSFTNYRQGCSFGTTLEIRSSLSSDFGRLAVSFFFFFPRQFCRQKLTRLTSCTLAADCPRFCSKNRSCWVDALYMLYIASQWQSPHHMSWSKLREGLKTVLVAQQAFQWKKCFATWAVNRNKRQWCGILFKIL